MNAASGQDDRSWFRSAAGLRFGAEIGLVSTGEAEATLGSSTFRVHEHPDEAVAAGPDSAAPAPPETEETE